MHGLYLIDKPSGMTSHDVVSRMRRICKTRKVGHAGTLDPMATGVLPVAVGKGTKVLQFLLAENKSYRATLKLGVTTDTLDIEGEVLTQRPVPAFFEDELESVCDSFRGEIDQLPPMYSALKQNGVPLYKLARQGKEVERKPRRVCIDRLDIVKVEGDQIVIDVDCSKGTYIRSLAADIGEQLGCGACLTALNRTSSGDFKLEDCVGLDQLREMDDPTSVILSPYAALSCYPAVRLSDSAYESLTFGIPPELSRVESDTHLAAGSLVRLAYRDELAAVARFSPLRENETRGDFELIRVFVSH